LTSQKKVERSQIAGQKAQELQEKVTKKKDEKNQKKKTLIQ